MKLVKIILFYIDNLYGLLFFPNPHKLQFLFIKICFMFNCFVFYIKNNLFILYLKIIKFLSLGVECCNIN